MPLAAETTGTITSVLSISRLTQAFSKARLRGFQLNLTTPYGAGRVTPAVIASPQMSDTACG
ncbi:hypothetical protein D3C87_1975730 [compost metagenome]